MRASFPHARCVCSRMAIGALFVLHVGLLQADEQRVVRFPVTRGTALEVWRITHDPAVRDHANYHNTQCWSPDGRHLCFTHYAAGNKTEYGNERAAEIHLFDLAEERDVLVDRGLDPRWAHRRPWLLYTRLVSADGPRNGGGAHQMWLDVASGESRRIGYGLGRLMGTDCEDRWLYGIWSPDDAPPRAVRIPIREDSQREVLPGDWGVGYNSLNVNPAHPLIVSRDHNYADNYFATPGTLDIPFKARHFFDHGLAGESPTAPFPIMDSAHFAWSGDGTYFLPGNGPLRGRRWDEPLPANIHFLANISAGDVCPCGFSGRWICGSTGGGTGPLQIADLRSGEGRMVLPSHSFLCFPEGRDNSGPYDIDAKGSPDGTKIAFVSTYDLQHGPSAQVLPGSGEDEIRVDSTHGFPDAGELVNPAGFGGEVLPYAERTPTSFRRLTRGLYGTDGQSPLRTDRMLMAFDSLLLPAENRKPTPLPARWMRDVVKDLESPLMWQRQTDLYVAVVRQPDPPHLRWRAEQVELIPGENHWETRGYIVLRDGVELSPDPITAGDALPLPGAGTYSARAVEWSGLKSVPSLPLEVTTAAPLHIHAETPDDFQWTHERYIVDGQEASRESALQAREAVREIVHLHKGTIHREWLSQGVLMARHDLNPQGQAIRRLQYEEGRLSVREYWDRDDELVSTERFDAAGFITESIHGRNRWTYERGVPVRFTNGTDVYSRQGPRWVKEE